MSPLQTIQYIIDKNISLAELRTSLVDCWSDRRRWSEQDIETLHSIERLNKHESLGHSLGERLRGECKEGLLIIRDTLADDWEIKK